MEGPGSQFEKINPEELEDTPFYGIENEYSLIPLPPEEIELSFNDDDFKHIKKVQTIFFDKIDKTITEEGLIVHERIAEFLSKLISKYGEETVGNCVFYHILAMNSSANQFIPTGTERLDLEGEPMENFINNGFRETESF